MFQSITSVSSILMAVTRETITMLGKINVQVRTRFSKPYEEEILELFVIKGKLNRISLMVNGWTFECQIGRNGVM